jgi:hypothetical protein
MPHPLGVFDSQRHKKPASRRSHRESFLDTSFTRKSGVRSSPTFARLIVHGSDRGAYLPDY